MKKQEIIEAIAVGLADRNEPDGYGRFPIHKIIDIEKRRNARFTFEVASYITAKFADYKTDGTVVHELWYYMYNGSTVMWRCRNLTKEELLAILAAITEQKAKKDLVYVVAKEDCYDYYTNTDILIVTKDRKKAQEKFEGEKGMMQADAEEHGYEQEESESSYSCWADGEYGENHQTVRIYEKNLE